ncbi:MAG: HAD family hydrolase [Pseudomonadota bacterium]
MALGTLRVLIPAPSSWLLAAILPLCLLVTRPLNAQTPLSSWGATPTREAILGFIEATVDPANDAFVQPEDRIAVFDNDGTLWAEQPAYFQLLFAVDRARAQLAEDPTLKSRSPYRELAADDLGALLAGGHDALFDLVFATHAGLSTTEFRSEVLDWLASARHPGTARPYTKMVYAPMLELLDYLRARGYRNFIVSGGGVGFLRAWSEDVYAIPPERVVGSRLELSYQEGDTPSIMRGDALAHVNDGPGKPVGIQQIIGRRPVLAVGNSDGDFEMLRWTTTGSGPRLGVLIHHTDGKREWAYDRESSIGRLDRGLDSAEENGWVVVDMKADWRRVFPD